jgi:hypothetical protein
LGKSSLLVSISKYDNCFITKQLVLLSTYDPNLFFLIQRHDASANVLSMINWSTTRVHSKIFKCLLGENFIGLDQLASALRVNFDDLDQLFVEWLLKWLQLEPDFILTKTICRLLVIVAIKTQSLGLVKQLLHFFPVEFFVLKAKDDVPLKLWWYIYHRLPENMQLDPEVIAECPEDTIWVPLHNKKLSFETYLSISQILATGDLSENLSDWFAHRFKRHISPGQWKEILKVAYSRVQTNDEMISIILKEGIFDYNDFELLEMLQDSNEQFHVYCHHRTKSYTRDVCMFAKGLFNASITLLCA